MKRVLADTHTRSYSHARVCRCTLVGDFPVRAVNIKRTRMQNVDELRKDVRARTRSGHFFYARAARLLLRCSWTPRIMRKSYSVRTNVFISPSGVATFCLRAPREHSHTSRRGADSCVNYTLFDDSQKRDFFIFSDWNNGHSENLKTLRFCFLVFLLAEVCIKVLPSWRACWLRRDSHVFFWFTCTSQSRFDVSNHRKCDKLQVLFDFRVLSLVFISSLRRR